MFEYYLVLIDRDLSRCEYQNLLRLVSPKKRERIERFYRFADAQRTLLGEALVRMITSKELGLDNDQIKFSHNEYGKPFLLGYDRYQFNLSHAGRYVACATDDEPIGIDIEELRQVDMGIAKRLYSEDEKRFLFSQSEDQTQKTFYKIWTRKESYIKRDSRGLSIPLPSFSALSASDVSFHQVFENKEAICNVCTAKQKQSPIITTLSIDDIVCYLLPAE
jgi:4'-phosphopantetheinyl transferase